jgi:O-antigen/teichoic acid export membrane protein
MLRLRCGTRAEQAMNDQQQGGGRTDLGKVALVGSVLQMAGRGLRALVGIATIAVLARFLSPSDFGAFALIYALVMLAQVFADLGLRVALVQKAEITDIECQSVFWASTLSGGLLTALVIAFAHPISRLFGDPTLAPAVMASAPIFVIIGMRGVPLALLERRFMFKQIAATDLAAAIVGSLAALGFALGGLKVGALVAQQVAMVVVLAVMLFTYARWLPRFQFSRESLKPLAGYGSYVTLTGVLYSAGPMINRPLIGTRLSTADLGYLTMSDQLVMTPVRVIAQSIRRVTFPLLASFQTDNARIVQAHQNTLHALAATLAPVVIGIAALAEPVTVLLLGPSWVPLTTILALVAPRALIATIGEMHSSVLASKGEARFQFVWGVFTLLVSIGTLLLMIPFGIQAVAAGQLVVSALLILPVYSWFLARLLGTPMLGLFTPMGRPLLAAILMGLAVFALDQWLKLEGLPILPRALIGSALGAASYGLLILLIDRAKVKNLLGKVRAARQKRKA